MIIIVSIWNNNMTNLNVALMFLPFLLFSAFWVPSQSCQTNCASCRNLSLSDYYCLACSDGSEIVTGYNICIQDTTIQHCAIYDWTLNCLTCKPTFSWTSSTCIKMYDGCLLHQDGACFLCERGSFISSDSGSCVAKYINCRTVASNGSCGLCYPQFVLDNNGRCVQNSTNCATVNIDTGLCNECASGWTLLGYQCISKVEVAAMKNCYLVNRGTNLTCQYCKIGYGVYYGNCEPYREIIQLIGLSGGDCSNPLYMKDNWADCFSNDTNLQNCLVPDFGLMTCLLCQPMFTLNAQAICQTVLDDFCDIFDSKGLMCVKCKDTFYLKGEQCLPFPPFCISYSNGCIQCASAFQLQSGSCVDPNCQTVNAVTGICQICLINYQLNAAGVCRQIDENCRQTDSQGNCLQCQNGYTLKSTGLCTFQDANCLSFNNLTGACNLCRPFYYYNIQGQICIPLPNNCIIADISGRCTQCSNTFVLTSSFQCLFLTAIRNCHMVDQGNYSRCATCINGFFPDSRGNCNRLPQFCSGFDPVRNICTQCSSQGVMRGGMCVDKNCQILDLGGGCLGCLQGYIFSSLGQCVPQVSDPNCKQYLFGICKGCIERYYFDFQFNCVAVSPFCNTYDSNSGGCTSCYGGYALSVNGDCNLALMASMSQSLDILDNYCKAFNSRGQCIACQPNFDSVVVLASTTGGQSVVSCVQKISGQGYCLQYGNMSGGCVKCVSRMFVDGNGSCKSVDENCDLYNQTTGACISCYSGFSVSLVNGRMTCAIVKGGDPNCQISGNGFCSQCYQGYYYSPQSVKCIQVNPQCATYNQTNGNCLTCYSGYQLLGTSCVLGASSNTPPPPTLPTINLINNIANSTLNTSKSNQENSFSSSACLSMNLTNNMCTNCQWGYALINGICIQKDLNCQIFDGSNSLKCLQCYDGYKVYGVNSTQCVLSSLLVSNCLKYDKKITCIQCNNGYVLTASIPGVQPSYTCNVIDQNCQKYNALTNQCQKCNEGTVLEGRMCIFPIYGVDSNCVLYANGVCSKCRSGWTLSGFLCSQ